MRLGRMLACLLAVLGRGLRVSPCLFVIPLVMFVCSAVMMMGGCVVMMSSIVMML